jgi:O-methyltransferase
MNKIRNLFRVYKERHSIQFHVLSLLSEWERKGLVDIGCYIEFGCFRGASSVEFSRVQDKYFPELRSRMKMYLFDSFVGLPDPVGDADAHPKWAKGTFDIGGVECFRRILASHSIPECRYELIPGFYEDSLPKFKWNSIDRASFIFMDCDYYSSTVQALDAIKGKLDNYSIIYFDDLHSFSGNPSKGQLRAIEEFNLNNKDVGLNPCPLLSNIGSGRIYWAWRNS